MAKDLDNAFKLYLDKVDSQGVADFLPAEREKFLNDANLKLARKLVRGQDTRQPAVDARRTLRKQVYVNVEVSADQEVYQGNYPADYLQFARLRVNTFSPTSAPALATPTLASEDELSRLLEDPFNRSTLYAPICCLGARGIEVYRDSAFQVKNLQLTYYKRPSKISLKANTSTDLPEEILPELVELAVFLAKKSLESPDASFQAQTLTPVP